MKKKLHLLFSVLFIISFYFTSTLSAQNPNLQWKKVNKGEFSGDDIVLCSTRDNASNNYVCGYNNSSTFIAKFDNTGANTFSFVYVDSTNSYITPAKLFVDASGNIIMVGSKNTAGIVLPMVIKFNSQGTVLWENI